MFLSSAPPQIQSFFFFHLVASFSQKGFSFLLPIAFSNLILEGWSMIPMSITVSAKFLKDVDFSWPAPNSIKWRYYLSSRLGRVLNTLTASLQRRNPWAKSVLNTTLNSIWWCGSSSEALGNVEYPFFAITPRSTFIWSGITCWSFIFDLNRTIQSFIILKII